MIYYFCCLDHRFSQTSWYESSMDRLSKILIDVFNTPSLISVVMQNRKHL